MMRTKILMSMLIIPSTIALSVDSKKSVLDVPERELRDLHTTLENLKVKITASKNLSRRSGLGSQESTADHTYDDGMRLFKAGEYAAALGILKSYLNFKQIPDPEKFLSAHKTIGHCYEMLNKRQLASIYYTNYLAFFVTQQKRNDLELIEVLRQLMPLSASAPLERKKEIEKLLSSVTTLELVDLRKAEILYLSARTALSINRLELAEKWLQLAHDLTNDPSLKVRSIYFSSLIALNNKDYEKAKIKLLSTEKMLDAGAAEYRDLSMLALARIAVHQKHPETALKYYDNIKENSLNYKDALFESIYVALSANEYQQAHAKAALFLAKYKDYDQALSINNLKSFLDLKARRYDDAKEGIKRSETSLVNLADWIHQNYSGKERLTHKEVSVLFEKTKPHVQTSPTLARGKKIFDHVAVLNQRLNDIRSDIRNSIYTVGRTNMVHLKPQWVNQVTLLSQFAEQTLEVGHRLSTTERLLYSKILDQNESEELRTSEKRRFHILSEPAQVRRKMMLWASLGTVLTYNNQLINSYQELQNTKAKINTARYLTEKNSPQDKDAKLTQLNSQSERVKILESSLLRSVELLRLAKFQDILNQSPHRGLKKFMNLYATTLYEESLVLSKYRDRLDHPSQKVWAEQAGSTWSLWRYVSKLLYENIADFEQVLADELNQTSDKMHQLISSYDELSSSLNHITDMLEETMGSASPQLVSHYLWHIKERQARHQKWRADLDWLAYEEIEQKRQQGLKKFELERQILSDNLKDLEQGVLWP